MMTPVPKENKPDPVRKSGEGAGPAPMDDSTSGEEEEEDIVGALDEFDAVNSYLDSLNSALDMMEQRSDNLKTKLLTLLQENREVRQSIAEEKKHTVQNDPDNDDDDDNAGSSKDVQSPSQSPGEVMEQS